MGSRNIISSIALDSSGRILAGGSAVLGANFTFSLARYSETGTLDTSFGTSGFTNTAIGTYDQITSITVDSSGRILAAGSATIGGSLYFVLARYLTTGSLDTSFGSGGTTKIGVSSRDFVPAITLDRSGRILASGYSLSSGAHFRLARFLDSGAIDTTFGVTGFVATGAQFRAVTVAADGTIFAAGTSATPNGRFILSKYSADGILDTSFATAGSTSVTPGTSDQIYSLAIDISGRIVVGGSATVGGSMRFALGRFLATGELDSSFGTAGFNTITSGTSDSIASITIESSGRIIMGGQSTINGSHRLTVAAYLPTGVLDTSFGNSGFTTETSGTTDYLNSILLDPTGRLVAGGSSVIVGKQSFILARYLTRYLSQSALSIATTSGAYGTPLALSTIGGSGTGALTYSTSTPGCSISSDAILTETGTLSCTVTALKAADATYSEITSPPTVITLAKAILMIIPSDTTTVYGTPVRYEFSYQGFVNGDSATATSFTTGLIPPTCGISETATATVANSPLTITCSGGSSALYTFAYSRTAHLTINPAPTTVVVPQVVVPPVVVPPVVVPPVVVPPVVVPPVVVLPVVVPPVVVPPVVVPPVVVPPVVVPPVIIIPPLLIPPDVVPREILAPAKSRPSTALTVIDFKTRSAFLAAQRQLLIAQAAARAAKARELQILQMITASQVAKSKSACDVVNSLLKKLKI